MQLSSGIQRKWFPRFFAVAFFSCAAIWHSQVLATEYFQAGLSNIGAKYAGHSATINALELRYGNYLNKQLVIEGVAAFGTNSKTIIQQGPTNGTEDVLGRASQFDNMSVGLELDSLLGFYIGYRKIVDRFDFVARLGLVHLSYGQPMVARNARININGNPGYQVKYEENLGGSALGLSVGLSMAYFVTRTGALTLEVISLPEVDDTVFGESVSGATRDSFSEVKANAVIAGVRFHF